MAETTTDKNLTDEEDETDLSNNHDLVSVYLKEIINRKFFLLSSSRSFFFTKYYIFICKIFFVLESW